MTTTGRCDHCGQPHSRMHAPDGAWLPCPRCGEQSSISYSVELNEVIEVHETLRVKAKRPEKKKPFKESVSGDDFSHAQGRWVTKVRVIDRDNDEYHEVITGPDGEIIHDCHERLSDHWSHGSAKEQTSQ